MGRYDDITPERLRTKLVRFSRLVLKLEEKGMLLEKSTALLKLMGELRQMIFAWEVRGTKGLESVQRWAEEREEEARERDADRSGRGEGDEGEAAPGDPSDPSWLRESMRIVEESLRRQEELQDELGEDLFSDEEEDEE